MTVKKLRIKPGFLLLLAALFYLDEGVGLLPWGLLACAAHECGHLAAGRFLGGRLDWLELSAVGAQMNLSYASPLSYGGEIAVALAGPAVNLALGWAALQLDWVILAGVNLGIAGFNLLPVLPLDGGGVVWNGTAWFAGEAWAERVLPVISAVFVGLLAGAGAVVAVHFANISLLVTASWLLWVTLGRKMKKSAKNSLHFPK